MLSGKVIDAEGGPQDPGQPLELRDR